MPRQRKPQSGVARAAGRVANTTTSLGWKDIANTNPKVYRIPTWGMRTECPAPLSEVGWVYPISVRREGNTFYVSLPEENLKSVIEGMETLDLSNVTVSMNTINWPLTISGSITSDWTIAWQAINWTDATFDSVTSTSWNITNLTSSDVTATTITSNNVSTWALTASGNALINGTLWVTWVTTMNDVTAWDITAAGITATTWDITTLNSTAISTETLAAVGNITTQSDLEVSWASSLNGITNNGDLSNSWNIANGWNVTVAWTTTSNGVTTTTLNATGLSSLKDTNIDGNATVTGTLWVTWATTLNSTLTVVWATNLSDNVSVGGNLTVAGNTTVTWNQTITGDAIFSNNVSTTWDLTVSGDITVTDDLTVNGTTHLHWVETDGSVDIDWTLRVTGAINGANWITITGQVESDTVRTWEVIANEARISEWLYLSQWAEAPDFVLQSEKGEPNGVAPLNANGIIDDQYLPAIYTSAIVKIGTWTFDNSYTSTVHDDAIGADSFVAISNYQDIVWDTTETISLKTITVVSNHQETWSYKYIVVNPLPACP